MSQQRWGTGLFLEYFNSLRGILRENYDILWRWEDEIDKMTGRKERIH
jgi:hypothetical protein